MRRCGAGLAGFVVTVFACAGMAVAGTTEHYFSAGLIRADPVSGARSILSTNLRPPGEPHLDGPVELAVGDRGKLLIADTGTGRPTDSVLIEVDPGPAHVS